MSDSAGGGDSEGVAAAGQDADGDSEPPQRTSPPPESDCLELEKTSPPAAKRLRMNEEDRTVVEDAELPKLNEEPTEQPDHQGASKKYLLFTKALWEFPEKCTFILGFRKKVFTRDV